MLKNIQLATFAFLLLFASLHAAHSISVWTLDEQLSSTNLTVLRFKVKNIGQQTIRSLELHYRVKQNWNEIAPAENYYAPGANMEWVQLGGGEALLKISFPNVVLEPTQEFPNSSGFSVGLHTKNWSAWNKREHYSQPISGTFTLTDKVLIYSNGILLNGETVPNVVACPDVWFLEIQTDSVKIGWKPSNKQEQTTLELRGFDGASRQVNLTQAADSGSYKEWSGAFPVQHQNHGELWLNCSGKMVAYFAYGLAPKNAEPAVEAGLWDDESDFVKAHAEFGYNMGISPGERFIVSAGEFGRRVSDWKLYRPWEAPDLPELPTIAFPGLGVAFMPETPNDSMLFAWTAIEGFSLYQLYVVKNSAYGDTLHSLLVQGTEIRLPTPPPGVYVWWAEPVVLTRGFWSSFKKAMKVVIDYTDPILSNVINDISPSSAIIPPVITKPPIGIFKIIQEKLKIREKTLGLIPIRARKDTRMLDLGWMKKETEVREMAIDSGWWDSPDTNTTGDIREDVKGRCWAIAVQQMNHYFGGNMTQDEIVYHGKSSNPIEEHFPHGSTIEASGWPSVIPTMGFALNTSPGIQNELSLIGPIELMASVPGWFPLLPPDPYVVIASIEARIPLVVVQANEGYEDGMHVMVIDGYKIYADGSIHLHFVGTHNEGTAGWREYASFHGLGVDVLTNMLEQGIDNLANKKFGWSGGANFYVAYYIPPPHAHGRLTALRAPSDSTDRDSDGDGILDFDEINRFGTDPYNVDSDGDGIQDKDEIAYYTRMGVDADIDGDGLRAELDVDSDNDGDCDGDENANKNDRKDGDNETDMMDSTKHSRDRCKVHDMALVASEQININDRAYCTDGSKYCPIVSMGRFGWNAVQLGVSAKVGSILAGSSVWLRSRASVSEDIRTSGTLILQDATSQVLGDIKENDAETAMLVQVYRPLLSSFKTALISGTINIPSGHIDTLQPKNAYGKNIVVSSGSVLRLLPENYQIGSLTVQSGGKIELLGSDSIVLDISGTFKWDGSFNGNSLQNVASRLKIVERGHQDIFLNTSFGGFLVAPNAHVVVGQASKEYAGQIYAKRITLHQDIRFLWIKPGSQQEQIATFNRGVIHVSSSN